jgi:hypothetical protein
MKTPPDFSQEFRQRVAAPPTRSFNKPRRSTDLPVEVLQASRMWRLFPVRPQGRLAPEKLRIEEATADLAQLEQWCANSQAAIGAWLPGWPPEFSFWRWIPGVPAARCASLAVHRTNVRITTLP